MNKKLAHILFLLFDLLSLYIFWIGYTDFKNVLVQASNQIEIIKFGSREGFFIVGIGLPLLHCLIIVENLLPRITDAFRRIFTWTVLFIVITLLAAGFGGSSWLEYRVKRAGYVHCWYASGNSALAKTLVYAKNMKICEKLAAERKAGK